MKTVTMTYLMYADLDFKHPEVIQNIYDWVWLVHGTTGVAGFRLDAVKHIDSFFMRNFIRDMKEKYGEDFYVFGDFGILTRKPIWTILKKRKNALTLSMFVSIRISLMLAEQVPTMTFVAFSQIAWLNSSLTRLWLLSTTTIPNEVRLLSLLLKNGSNQRPMPSFCYAKMAFHVSFTETTMGFQGSMLNKISKKSLTAS